ncbi:MAG: ABC transporter ATP-binding protein [Planctomycetota bacterium]
MLLGCLALLVFVMGRGAIASAIKESKTKYAMAAWLEDIALNRTTFLSEGGPALATGRADELIHGYLSSRQKHFRILMRQIVFALALQAVASTVLLGLGGFLVINRELTLGQLVASELIVAVIVGAFAKLGKHMEGFYDLMASIDKLGTLIDLPVQREDGMMGFQVEGALPISMSSVSYGWPSSKPVIDNFSAEVPAGSSLAVYGPSGSGKSTLIDLIGGLRAPKAGELTLGGNEPRDVRPDVLHRHVAVVRGNEVFQASVEENVHLDRNDINAVDVRNALEDVGLLHGLSRLPDGPRSMLSTGGSPLSENECRRLGIARAIAGRPSVLLIDGVLDSLSDEEVEPILTRLLDREAGWTVVIATGRESIAQRCETLVYLRQPFASPGSSR